MAITDVLKYVGVGAAGALAAAVIAYHVLTPNLDLLRHEIEVKKTDAEIAHTTLTTTKDYENLDTVHKCVQDSLSKFLFLEEAPAQVPSTPQEASAEKKCPKGQNALGQCCDYVDGNWECIIKHETRPNVEVYDIKKRSVPKHHPSRQEVYDAANNALRVCGFHVGELKNLEPILYDIRKTKIEIPAHDGDPIQIKSIEELIKVP